MKTSKKVGIVAAVLLTGGSFLYGSGMQDSVMKKETKALSQSDVKGEAAAKAKVEEAQDREEFEAKMERGTFEKEAISDEKREVNAGNALKDDVAKEETRAVKKGGVSGEAAAKAKVEEAQDKEEFEAKMKRQTFENEAAEDEKR